MGWTVEYTDEFGGWWEDLSEEEQDSVDRIVGLLELAGPSLPFPYSSKVNGSIHGQMRELRIQCEGQPYRVLYAFDPRRAAILLLGGNKTGDERWYEANVPKADKLYDRHLKDLKRETRNNG